jgi:hypothetical protein
MTSRYIYIHPFLAAIVFASCSLSAQAMPKAAEHEDAPVTTSADVMHPKRSTRAMVQKKASKEARHSVNKKSGKTVAHPPRTTYRKK